MPSASGKRCLPQHGIRFLTPLIVIGMPVLCYIFVLLLTTLPQAANVLSILLLLATVVLAAERKTRFTVLRRKQLWLCTTLRKTSARSRKFLATCSNWFKARLVEMRGSTKPQQDLRCHPKRHDDRRTTSARCEPIAMKPCTNAHLAFVAMQALTTYFVRPAAETDRLGSNMD